MTKFIITLNNIIKQLTDKIASILILIETNFQTTFHIKHTTNDRLGFLNSFILIAGISSLTLFTTLTFNSYYLTLFFFLTFIILFLISLFFNTNHFIHTLAILGLIISTYFYISKNFDLENLVINNIYLGILLILSLYFDLLKKNFLLQLTSIYIIMKLIANHLINFQIPSINFFNFRNIFSNLLNSFVPSSYLLLVLTFLSFGVWSVLNKSKRHSIASLFKLLSHSLIVILLFNIIINSSPIFGIIILIFCLIIALYNSMLHNYSLTGTYILLFFISVIYMVFKYNTIDSSMSFVFLSLIFFLMTILSIIAKILIDKGYKL
jgi:hypothetical protein